MPRKTVRPIHVITLTLALGIAGAALAQAGKSLTFKGQVVSHDLRIIGGRPYVPLADVARILGGSAVKSGAGYAIRAGDIDTTTPSDKSTPPAGGADQVNGLRGKVGQVLFTGKWRFQVVSVDHTSSYATKYQADADTITPNGDSDELVVIMGQLKNAQKKAVAPTLSSVHPHNTALTDDQGQSYPPLKFDKRGGDNDSGGTMLPGSASNFAVLFSVPKGTQLKDLVFSVQNFDNDDMPDGGKDVRVLLAP